MGQYNTNESNMQKGGLQKKKEAVFLQIHVKLFLITSVVVVLSSERSDLYPALTSTHVTLGKSHYTRG
jgi:hypothetical protein